MTDSQPPQPPTLIEVLLRISTSWTARLLVGLFIAAEVVNFGVFPFVLKSIEAKTAAAQSETEAAKASVAKLREDALADAVTEEARVKAGQALHGDRFRKAEARYADNMSKVIREKALNSPELKQAETVIKRQTAAIDDERAKHEERRARAEAQLKAAQAQLSDAEATLKTITLRADLIEERKKAFLACTAEQDLRYQNSQTGVGISPCSIYDNNYQQCQYRWNRRCLASVTPVVLAPPTPAQSVAKPPNVPANCRDNYAEWLEAAPTYPRNSRRAAYVIGEVKCGWSIGQRTAEDARRVAMKQCQVASQNCVLFDER